VTPLLAEILRAALPSLMPPERLSLSAWAERYAVLSAENSAVPGPWRAYPYQVGVMDAFTDPTVERITVVKSARIGWTRILDHAIGYAIHQDPAPLLIVQPTIEDAEDYSRDELEPMLRDTPALAGLAAEAKSRDKHSTVKRKNFPGGSLRLIGANAPRGFRRVTVKRVFFDEVDGYPTKGAGVEGDQIALGIKRADTYYRKPGYKIALGSTPTRRGASRIEASYAESDQRRYLVPCLRCGEEQELVWANFRWPDGKPEEVRYVCCGCGALIEEREKYAMVSRGRWAASAAFGGHAGFFIWAAYSFSPGAAWPKIAAEYEEAQRLPSTLTVFVNQVLGQSYVDEGEYPDDGSLAARRERWVGVPDEVLFTTLGVDVQKDRLEYEHVGWGEGEENWSLEVGTIVGDPGGEGVWRDLSDLIVRMGPAATCVDSGGLQTQQVYSFANAHTKQRVYAVKGAAGAGRTVWPRSPTHVKRGGRLYVIGVDAAKDAIYSRLRVRRPGPGCCHFPFDRPEEWFAGLTSETVVVRHSKGFPIREYKLRPHMRNEPLDCRVYAYAALCSFGRVNWSAIAKRKQKTAEAKREAAEAVPEAAPLPQDHPARGAAPQRRGGGGSQGGTNWVSGWRR
jgi:phage terminase large subunit GpA-like protein